jgi:hypothetical protein
MCISQCDVSEKLGKAVGTEGGSEKLGKAVGTEGRVNGIRHYKNCK